MPEPGKKSVTVNEPTWKAIRRESVETNMAIHAIVDMAWEVYVARGAGQSGEVVDAAARPRHPEIPEEQWCYVEKLVSILKSGNEEAVEVAKRSIDVWLDYVRRTAKLPTYGKSGRGNGKTR